MSKVRVFRSTTLALFFVSLLSGVLHVLLLASDSLEYRVWVRIQIAILLAATILFWFIRRFSFAAFLALIPLSIVFVYINATFVNYGNATSIYLGFIVCWLTYGALAKGVWGEFQGSPGGAA